MSEATKVPATPATPAVPTVTPAVPASPAAPPAPTPAPVPVPYGGPKQCSTCEFWAPQAGISKGVCRVPADDAAMTVLSNDPSAMLLTAPGFYCSEWVLD